MALFSCGASAGLNYLFDVLLLADVRKPIIICLHCLDIHLSVCVEVGENGYFLPVSDFWHII